MKIALAQINPKVGDLDGNTKIIIDNIKQAREKGADIVIFPELALIGYPPRDLLDFHSFVEDNIAKLHEIKDHTEDIGVFLGFADFNKDKKGRNYKNTAAFIYNKEIVAKYNKILLPFYDVFDETRYFEPGTEPCIIEFKGKKIGLTICEDIWNDKDAIEKAFYRENPVEKLYNKDIDFIVNLSASPFYVDKDKIRLKEVQNVARNHNIPIIYVNQVGGNDDILFDGTSFVVDAKGNLVARCADFKEDLLITDIDSMQGEIKPIASSPEESILKALIKGLQDYMSKMGFKKVILGLSGGIDSALTAAIACMALESENVLGITMPSMYSSSGSINDSFILAEKLGMKCKEIAIKPMFDEFIKRVQDNEVFVDLAEENLQARIRSNILMLHSNRYGYMLLSTGNKSEMAVGYCTLYGDMSGGLNFLSDVPKTMVYKISRYINREEEIIPHDIIEKPPSAELRPDQFDQDSLPSYEVLDDIIEMYIEESKDPSEIAQKYPIELVKDVIKKINNTEYKRNQSTLGLKVTSRAFGTGRRFPIVQGYNFRIF